MIAAKAVHLCFKEEVILQVNLQVEKIKVEE